VYADAALKAPLFHDAASSNLSLGKKQKEQGASLAPFV
jgi:hypothetical protein